MAQASVKSSPNLNKTILNLLNKYSIYFILALLVIIMTFLSPAFLKPMNIINIIRQDHPDRDCRLWCDDDHHHHRY